MTRISLLALVLLLTAACNRGGTGAAVSGTANLQPVALPELTQSDESVQRQIRELHAAVSALQDRDAPAQELGAAFGELGMVLQSARFREAAEVAYRNAQALLADDPRWPYYLGLLYKAEGQAANAIESFERALQLRPDDVPALIWLSALYVEQGRTDDGERLLVRAQKAQPRAVAVLSGLGQVALARRDYAAAVRWFEDALVIDPRVASLHAPLAAAYRGLGDSRKADAHMTRWSDTALPVEDPLSDQLQAVLQSGLSIELRGVRAFEAGDWTGAAALFREGLRVTPVGTLLARSLRQKLGLALYLAGDPSGAVREFDEVVRQSPAGGRDEPAARAHYSLAVIRAAEGRDVDAVGGFLAAIGYNPTYVQAHLAVAHLLRRTGRFEASLSHYREVARLAPRTAEARLGYALALTRLGRWAEARQWLEQSVGDLPDRRELAHALARLLAAAPDARARDGQRALTLAQAVLEVDKRTDVGETMAMAYAEVGEFEQAAAIQRGVMQAAERARLGDEVRRMTVNLRRYEQRQPCRTPWADGDPIHRPGVPPPPTAAADVQAP